jgi:hypothetical protein
VERVEPHVPHTFDPIDAQVEDISPKSFAHGVHHVIPIRDGNTPCFRFRGHPLFPRGKDLRSWEYASDFKSANVSTGPSPVNLKGKTLDLAAFLILFIYTGNCYPGKPSCKPVHAGFRFYSMATLTQFPLSEQRRNSSF